MVTIQAYNEISERLEKFMDNHLQYWDDGDSENGPHLCCDYDGPEWAARHESITSEGEGQWLFWCNLDPEDLGLAFEGCEEVKIWNE